MTDKLELQVAFDHVLLRLTTGLDGAYKVDVSGDGGFEWARNAEPFFTVSEGGVEDRGWCPP